MHFSSFIRTVFLNSVVSNTLADNFDVTVGKDGQLAFNPPTVNVLPGSTVTYHFYAKNHSVTQSSFADPCHPLASGFFSGFTPTPANTTSPTTWTVTVNDTKPIWVYCGQTVGDHCQKGMVHAINAPTTGNTFDEYKAKAATASTSTSPPDGLPIGGLRQFRVEVGADGLTYTPNNIVDLVGTVVTFGFNPKNHSVVQSSFADPCHPLSNGFSSGFIPTEQVQSGINFQVTIKDTKPIWFYCAQTAKTHCQAGMVGSINAPTTGNTLEAFTALAAKASGSTIPPNAPIGGILTVGGVPQTSLNGNVFSGSSSGGGSSASPSNSPSLGSVPPPGNGTTAAHIGMAGGAPPANYNWAPTISDNAASFLQLLNFIDNILLEILFEGYTNLTTGSWAGKYPQAITDTLGSMSAQALVHRQTATDSLQHYNKALSGTCKYTFPISTVDDFVDTVLVLLLLEIGTLLDITTLTAVSDPWLMPALTTHMGSKARMTAVVNMMQSHLAATAPREVMIPAPLVFSYAATKYVIPNSCPDKLSFTTIYPPLPAVKVVDAASKRTTSITFTIDSSIKDTSSLFVAWLGPWGNLLFAPVKAGDGNGSADVPVELYGHVWAVLVTKGDVKTQDLAGVTVAGPEVVWVTQP